MSEGNFEAKVSAKRETSSGIFLTLQIQPDDYTADLATLRVGSALMIGWAEVVNTAVEKITLDDVLTERTGVLPKERRPFDSLPLSQQAAIRCQDNDFKLFLNASNADDAAQKVRVLCGVNSRSDIKPDTDSGYKWGGIEAGYQQWLTTQRYGESRR